MANSIRPPTPRFLLFALGIVGFLVGGLAGMFGYMAIDSLIHPRGGEVRNVVGEYAAPYGLVGSMLGLIVGVWGGLRLEKRRG
jgi:hypothetical protein